MRMKTLLFVFLCISLGKCDLEGAIGSNLHSKSERIYPYNSIKSFETGIKKRQVLGGVSDVSTSDPTIVDLARSSLVLFDGSSDHSNKYKLIEITSATQQVVAGISYNINILIAPSDCAKTDSKPAHECNSLADGKSESCEISIWDRSWLPQGRETTFKCGRDKEQKFRSKRQVLGDASNVSTSDPTIVDLARSSLVLLDGTSDHSNKLKVLEITSASEQVVAGTLYKINVLITPSDCAKTDTKPAHECNSLTGGKSESCEISIWDRPWLPQGRETTFKCGSRTEQKFRSKRQVFGGASNVSTSDPTIVDLACSSLVLLDGTSDHSNKLKVLEITSASEQVVAGTLYKINVLIAPSDCAKTDSKPAHECNSLAGGKSESCEISIWDRPWLLQGRETTLKCGSRTEQKFRSKRQVFGGASNVSTSDPTIVDLARSSLVLLDGTSDHSNKLKVIEITSASEQVVAGTLYKISVLIAPSDCAKTDSKPAHECNSLAGGKSESCEISIWDRPWLPQGRETTFKCESRTEQKFRSKRQVLGDANNVSTSDPTIVDLARSSLALLDGASDHSNKLKVLEITSASEQVVAGTLYKINVHIAPSDCAKTDSKPAHECNSLAGGKSESCEISIWDRPWLLQGRETTFKCESRTEQKFRSKRQVLGDASNVSTSDPTIVDLARSSLALLDGTSDHSNKLKVIEITSASEQVVAGTLYKINVHIAPSDCAKTDSKPAHECNSLTGGKSESCEISIWDRPWLLQGRETTFKCGGRTEQKFRSRRSTALVGGVVPVSSTDRNIAELVEHTLTKLDEQTTLDHKYKLAEIASATSQVVEGSLYNIKVKIVPSDCLKTDTKARSECGIFKDNDPQLCQIKIWDRLWLPNGRKINVICDQTTYNFVEDVNGQNVQ